MGDRHAALTFAVARLSTLLTDLKASTFVDTDPEGAGLEDQPLYLNAAVVGESALPAQQLLGAILDIERQFGRERPYPGSPRTLDLDLILVGNEVVADSSLTLPHPRFRSRFFVLGPLAEVAADLVDPVSRRTVGELLRELLRDQHR